MAAAFVIVDHEDGAGARCGDEDRDGYQPTRDPLAVEA